MTRLDPRLGSVLRAIVEAHLSSGEPVGSSAVAGTSAVQLSPASVRTVMGRLEERGLLSQPHPSAGRLPTDAAYRVYVDQLMPSPAIPHADARRIDEAFAGVRHAPDGLLEEACRQLSLCSHQVGVLLAPDLASAVIEHVEFVRLDPQRLVAILVCRPGVVHHRVLPVDEDLPQSELDRIGRFVCVEFAGKTLAEMWEEIVRRLGREQAEHERLVARGLRLGRRTLAAGAGEAAVLIEGTSNLVDAPDLADRGRMRELIRTLEDKSRLVDLLTRLLDGKGTTLAIGRENDLDSLAECTVVAAPYGGADRFRGSVAVVGPTRMPYRRIIALVDYLACGLTRMLGDGDERTEEEA